MAYNGGMSKPFASLSGQLLIAMPGMGDPRFVEGVTLICQHDENGAVGLLVNRPSDFQLSDVLMQLELTCDKQAADARVPVLTGGPVQPERGFVLHRSNGEWDSSYRVNDHLAITTSRDVLAAIAEGTGPAPAAMMLGYAGWAAGQLEKELLDNAWLTAVATDDILFETAMDSRWQAATALVGIAPHQLFHHAGHA